MPVALSVVTEQLPKSQVGMTIEVPTELVDATYERVLNRLVSRAKIGRASCRERVYSGV